LKEGVGRLAHTFFLFLSMFKGLKLPISARFFSKVTIYFLFFANKKFKVHLFSACSLCNLPLFYKLTVPNSSINQC
jgi:hypothetical protein